MQTAVCSRWELLLAEAGLKVLMFKGQRDNPSDMKHKIFSQPRHLSAPLPPPDPFASGELRERLVPSKVALLAILVPEQET